MNEDLAEKKKKFWTLGLETIMELETERGILASSREEIYGCLFGRDSLITSINLLKAYEKSGHKYFLTLVRKVLLNLAELQGSSVNIESGEEPGKIIHEYREDNHAHLTLRKDKPWFTYPDGTMRNYDTVDATPLFLIAAARYIKLSGDKDFLDEIWLNVERALEWMNATSDKHKYGFLSYRFPTERTFGGLVTQSWMDSFESIFHEDDEPTPYPIAPAEVQSYAYLAYRLWAKELKVRDIATSLANERRATQLKKNFNKYFVHNSEKFELAFALDGANRAMLSPRSSMGHLLWAALTSNLDGEDDCILESTFIPKLVTRMFSPDLFEPQAGIRTLSKTSKKFDPTSYHNGSIWPHDTAIVASGLENFGYTEKANMLRESLRSAFEHFNTPVELFVYTDDGYKDYVSPVGQRACAKQAWSAASILALY